MAAIHIESIDRKVHTSSTGMMVERWFHFRPYSAFPDVLEALQGKVEKNQAGNWTRTLPAQDPYINSCYCNEASIEFADHDVVASSPSIMEAVDGDQAPERSKLKEYLETQREDPIAGTAGGVVRATYRPMVTALLDSDGQPSTTQEAFDWMDPTYHTSFRQVPWPDGLFVKTGAGGIGFRDKSIPKESGSPLHVPVIDFSIRRLLVGEVNWAAIRGAAGSVNSGRLPIAGGPSVNLPYFPRGTLRFENATVENRFSATGKVWFELTYHFQWLNYWDAPVFGEDGTELEGLQPVTWNHVFMRPSWLGLGGNKLGWYTVLRESQIPIFGVEFPWGRPDAGTLYKLMTFDHLFVQ